MLLAFLLLLMPPLLYAQEASPALTQAEAHATRLRYIRQGFNRILEDFGAQNPRDKVAALSDAATTYASELRLLFYEIADVRRTDAVRADELFKSLKSEITEGAQESNRQVYDWNAKLKPGALVRVPWLLDSQTRDALLSARPDVVDAWYAARRFADETRRTEDIRRRLGGAVDSDNLRGFYKEAQRELNKLKADDPWAKKVRNQIDQTKTAAEKLLGEKLD